MHHILSLFDIWLFLASVIVLFWSAAGFGRNFQLFMVLISGGLLVFPVDALDLYMYPRSLFGELSVTSKLFLLAWLIYRLGGPRMGDARQVDILLKVVAVFGLVFYPLSLGLAPVDPYSAGYSSPILPVLVAAAVAFSISGGFYLLGGALLAALWSYLFGILESDNLFDYLVDAPLFLYALGYCCITLTKKYRSGSRYSAP